MTRAIADTILAQLGGRHFSFMTGAKNLVALENGLQMSLPASVTRDRVNMAFIRLDRRDLYVVEVGKYSTKTLSYTATETIDGIDVANLRKVFTRLTGLYISL